MEGNDFILHYQQSDSADSFEDGDRLIQATTFAVGIIKDFGVDTDNNLLLLEDVSGTFDTENAGGGGAHNNMQPYMAINYIIRT